MPNGQNVPKDYLGGGTEMQIFFFHFSAETNFISAPSPPHS